MSDEDRSSVPRRVELREPDPAWASAYERERTVIESALAGLGLRRIEHIGSTAVPGIRAKPIIDIMVGVETYDLFDVIRGRLESLGYEYDENALTDDPGRHVFRKGLRDPTQLRSHHLHLTLLGSPYWMRILAFRDWLRAHPEVARDYERLKIGLAERFANDGRAHTRQKGEFVRRVEAMAMTERS
jgi:GrpB-like predicted nucleotidyltransferase (UPF0157 family)